MFSRSRTFYEINFDRWKRRKLIYQEGLNKVLTQGPYFQRESVTSRSVGGCCAKVCLFGFGGVIAVVGVLLCILWPMLVTRLIGSQLALSSGSRSYKMWEETPIPMYFHIYMFNWTNPEESLRGNTVKPAFTQMGPYVFLEHHSKKNVTWNENGTMTYLNQKQWHFLPDMSNGTLEDKVTNLNVVAMTVGSYCLQIGKSWREVVNSLIMFEESLIKTDTVGNLLFYGSDDPILKMVHILKKYIKTLPDMEKFGWFYKRNMSSTADGVFTMGSGGQDLNQLGLMTSWNYKNRTVFPGECGEVKGTYGEEFPPNSVEQSHLTLFANDLCSVLNLQRQKSSSKSGIPTVLFAGGPDVFSNTTTCYCQSDTSCPASGVRDLSACNGSPAMVSWPHFYLADPSYREAIDGMHPDPDKHQFFMNMAEVVSVPLEVKGRMQLNIKMQTIPNMSVFRDIKTTVIPMMWFSQEATVGGEMSSQLGVLVKLVQWGRLVLFGLGSVGGLLVALGVLLHYRGCLVTRDERLLQ